MKIINRVSFFTALFLIITISPILCSQTGTNEVNKKTVTIGFMKSLFSNVDVNDAHAAVKIWLKEILNTHHYSKKYNMKAKIYTNINELLKDEKGDKLSVLALNTSDYINYKKILGLTPVLVPEVNNSEGTKYLLLTKRDGKYNNLQDLKNKVIGVASAPNNQAASMWLDIILAKNKLSPKEKYFQKVLNVEKESQLILNLFFGQMDACIASENTFKLMKELNPQIGKTLKSILISPRYLGGLVCFIKTYNNPKDRKLFYNDAINVDKLVSGKQLLSLIKIDKLVPFKSEYLNNYIKLLKDYNRLVKHKK